MDINSGLVVSIAFFILPHMFVRLLIAAMALIYKSRRRIIIIDNKG
jgi:hypothetical protein